MIDVSERINGRMAGQTLNVPFAHTPFFVGREQELDTLRTQLQQSNIAAIGQALAVNETGGVGKTLLALEYAYRYGHEYQYVLWVRADSLEAFASAYDTSPNALAYAFGQHSL